MTSQPTDDSDWHRLVDVVTGRPTEHATSFRFRLAAASERPARPECLQVEIRAACEVLWSPHTRRNAPIYEADALEVFFDPFGGGRIYRELEVAPTGASFDAWILNATDLDRTEAPRELQATFPRESAGSPRVDVRIDGREPNPDDVAALGEGLAAAEWSVQWTIPLHRVDPSGGPIHPHPPGSVPLVSPLEDWRFNVFRIQHRGPGATPDLQAWRPTGRRDFHRPEAFASLLLS